MPRKKSPRYSEEFKKTIVNLHQNGKSYAEIEQEYGVSHSALLRFFVRHGEKNEAERKRNQAMVFLKICGMHWVLRAMKAVHFC